VFKIISQTPTCLEPLQSRLVPTLVSILESAQGDKVTPGLQAVALDMLQTLVRSSDAPLSPLLVESAFLPAVQCMMRTDDNSIMQVGSIML
jgi:hypothetical protein